MNLLKPSYIVPLLLLAIITMVASALAGYFVILYTLMGAIVLFILTKILLHPRGSGPKFYEILIFLLMFSGPPRFRSRDLMASIRGEIDWVVLLNLIIWTAGALLVFKSLFKGKGTISIPRFNYVERFGLLFACTLALTIFLSPAPYLTAFRVFQIFVMLLFAHVWVRRFGVDISLRSLLLGYVLMGISITVAAFVRPELVYVTHAGTFRLRGDYIANAGAVGAIGLILLLSYPVSRSTWALIFLGPLFSWMLFVSRTRSAYAAFIAFLFLVLLKSPKVYSLKALRYGLILAVPLVLIFQDAILSFLIREERSLYTLSDRTRVWSFLANTVLTKSPLLGLGFYTERIFVIEVNPQIGTAHGSLAMVFAGGGILATCAYGLLLLSMLSIALKSFVRKARDPKVFTSLSVLLSVLAIGLVSERTVIATPTGFTFYMLVSLLPEILREISQTKTERRV